MHSERIELAFFDAEFKQSSSKKVSNKANIINIQNIYKKEKYSCKKYIKKIKNKNIHVRNIKKI